MPEIIFNFKQPILSYFGGFSLKLIKVLASSINQRFENSCNGLGQPIGVWDTGTTEYSPLNDKIQVCPV